MADQVPVQRQTLSAAELRERRRRKILEGSEQRLRKVLYGASPEENEPLDSGGLDDPPVEGRHTVEHTLHPKSLSDRDALSRRPLSNFSEDKLESNSGTLTESSSHQTIDKHRSAEAQDMGILNGQSECRHYESATQSRNASSRQSPDNTAPRASLVQQILSNDEDADVNDDVAAQTQSFTRIYVCAVVAVLVRLLLHAGFASLVQNAVIPFLTLEILFIFHWIHNGMNADSGGGTSRMMTVLLNLYATILPQFVRTFQPFIHLLSRVIDDFAVYMFFFICVHVLVGQST